MWRWSTVSQEAEDATLGRDVFNEKPALEDLMGAEAGEKREEGWIDLLSG